MLIEITTIKTKRRMLVRADQIDMVIEHRDGRLPTAQELIQDSFRSEDYTQIVLRSGEQGVCAQNYDLVVEALTGRASLKEIHEDANTRKRIFRYETEEHVAAD